jgi:pSer/pThr/pTyr-binding forkhead associated (FHA) protein
MTILLVGEEGPYAGSRFALEPGEHIVGRRTRCAVALPDDKKVSREHAVIDVGRDTARLTDAGSRNGSFVNEERVIEQTLHAGDTVRFGDTVFRVEVLRDGEAGESSSSGGEPLLAPVREPLPAEARTEPPALRQCPNCGEDIPPNQTYGVCAFCACNLMPIFKGLVHAQRDVAGTQRLTCSHCGSLIGDYSQMACPACHLNFVTGRFPDGTAPGETPPPPPPVPPPPPAAEPPSTPAARRGCGVGLLLLAGWFVGWLVRWLVK